MGIVFRQSVKTSIVIFSGALLGIIITWLSARYVGKQQLGFSRNITYNAVLLSFILLSGLNFTLVVYIQQFANDLRRKQLLLMFCLVVPVIVALIMCIPFFAFKGWVVGHFQPSDIPYVNEFYAWMPVYTILMILQVILEQYLCSQMKVALAAFMREIVIRAFNLVILLLFIAGKIDFHTFIIATILVYVVPVAIYIFIARKTEHFGISFQLNSFSKSQYHEIGKFVWFHFLLSASLMLINSMDVTLLPLYDKSGMNAIATYGNVLVLLSFLQMPSKAMLSPTMTVLSESMANNDMTKARDIFSRSSINIQIATVLMALLISCNLENVIRLIGDVYAEILPVFLILLIGKIIDLSTGLNDVVLSIAKYYKFNLYLSVILVPLLFILLKTLVPQYGVFGAAWSTTIVYAAFNIVKYWFVKKKLNMTPFSFSTAKIIVSALPALAVGYLMPYLHNPVTDGLARCVVIGVVYVAMILWLKPSQDIFEYLATVKKHKKLF